MTQTAQTENKHEALDAYIASLGLVYNAQFVPQSASRNKDEKHKSLNWIITLSNHAGHFTTDYMQGIGHVPKMPKGLKSLAPYEREKLAQQAAETGKYVVSYHANIDYAKTKALPAPLLRDVLYCLISDASVLDYSGFDDWAAEFGYETDSRKAETTYRECLAIALKLKAILGDKAITDLRGLFNDY